MKIKNTPSLKISYQIFPLIDKNKITLFKNYFQAFLLIKKDISAFQKGNSILYT